MKFLILYILRFSNIVVSIKSKTVTTTLGPVKGKLVNDEITGASYYSYESIPYAEPPIGKLRFKSPVLKQAWSSVRDATKSGRVCPQIELFYSREEMDENCLTFNVYTPTNLNKLLPVMFYIHDGDFKLQSGNAEPIYGPQLFILNDVVVVTINYRLGALGFLSLCNEEVSGNAGIKDVLLALKVVYQNIARFGGNPKKITIMGNGAGAAIAQFLLSSKQCMGIVQNVILHSGSFLSSKFTQIYPRQNAMLLALELGLNVRNFNDTSFLKAIRNVDAYDIVNAQEAIERKDPQRGFRIFSAFKPTVEIPCEGAIITEPPLELIKRGAFLNITVFIGFNSLEGLEIFPLLRSEPELIDRLNENFELNIPADIQYPYGSPERKKLAAQIRERYFDGKNITLPEHFYLVSDSQFTYAIDLLVKLLNERERSAVYYYVFATDGKLNWFKKFANITYPGAAHNDDIGYPFLTSITKSTYHCLDSSTKKAQAAVSTDLKYFMNCGAPTPNPVVKYWPEAGKNRYHLKLTSDAFAIYQRPIPERIDFWSNVYEEYFNSKWNTGSYFCTKDDV